MRAVNLLPAAGPDKGQNETRSGVRTTKSIAVAAGLVLVVLAVVLGLAFTQTRTDGERPAGDPRTDSKPRSRRARRLRPSRLRMQPGCGRTTPPSRRRQPGGLPGTACSASSRG